MYLKQPAGGDWNLLNLPLLDYTTIIHDFSFCVVKQNIRHLSWLMHPKEFCSEQVKAGRVWKPQVCSSMFLHALQPPLPSSVTENVKRWWRQRLRGDGDSAWTVMRQDSFSAAGHAVASDTGSFKYCIRAVELLWRKRSSPRPHPHFLKVVILQWPDDSMDLGLAHYISLSHCWQRDTICWCVSVVTQERRRLRSPVHKTSRNFTTLFKSQ